MRVRDYMGREEEVRLIFIFHIIVALDPSAWGTRPGEHCPIDQLQERPTFAYGVCFPQGGASKSLP